MEGTARERLDRITALLIETGEAHGRYEEAELDGVYDQQWPRWYAAYAVEHGIGDLVGRPVTTDELAAFLATTNLDLERIEPERREPWSTYTARRIESQL